MSGRDLLPGGLTELCNSERLVHIHMQIPIASHADRPSPCRSHSVPGTVTASSSDGMKLLVIIVRLCVDECAWDWNYGV
jgi:hypothetical protein